MNNREPKSSFLPQHKSESNWDGNGAYLQGIIDEDIQTSPLLYQRAFRFVTNFIRIFIVSFICLLIAAVVIVNFFSISTTVEGSSIVEPREYTRIKSEITGIIQEILVTDGQLVEKGQLLAVLSDTEFSLNCEKAKRDLEISQADLAQEKFELRITEIRTENNIKEAEANLKLAKADLEKSISQYNLSLSAYQNVGKQTEKLTSMQDFPEIKIKQALVERAEALLWKARGDLAQIDVERAKIIAITKRMEKLQNDVALFQSRIDRARIYSPADGVVLTFDISQKIGDRILEGETILTIGDTSNWVARAMMKDMDIPKIKPGQTVKLYLKAFPYMEYRIFDGEVERVSPSPVLNERGQIEKDKNGNIFYYVFVKILDPTVIKENQALFFQYGLRADAKIVLKKQKIISHLWNKFFKMAEGPE